MKLKSILSLAGIAGFALSSCHSEKKTSDTNGSSALDSNQIFILLADSFKTEFNGKITALYTLKNSRNAEAKLTNYGARLVSLLIPDRNKKLTDVVVGFKSITDYINSRSYYGATIGRYGNRIAKARFMLDGKLYHLDANNGVNSLHGGKSGYQNVVWDAKQTDSNQIEFHYLSKDMEGGYPGNLEIRVTYTLTDNNELKINYQAKTDKTTVVNLTNHAFFNLNGEGSGSILNHSMKIYSDRYIPVDSSLIPTGEIEKVAGTPFDFTKMTAIGARINDENQQLVNGKGYDHNYILNQRKGMGMLHAATVKGDHSGMTMDVYTQEPGLQFYSGNFMDGSLTFKSGSRDELRTAFCLETQHFPDSPNQPAFPSTVLTPAEVYGSTSIYKFSGF